MERTNHNLIGDEVRRHRWRTVVDADLRPGDVLLFHGTDIVSRPIQLWTRSWWSHVGIVATVNEWLVRQAVAERTMRPMIQLPIQDHLVPLRTRNILIESTTLTKRPCVLTGESIYGVQSHDPIDRIENYPGEVWRMRLAPDWELSTVERDRLAMQLLRYVGTRYDGAGAVRAGSIFVKRSWLFGRADLSSVFCSELVALALKRVGRLNPESNPSRWTPADIFRRCTYSGVYDANIKRLWPPNEIDF